MQCNLVQVNAIQVSPCESKSMHSDLTRSNNNISPSDRPLGRKTIISGTQLPCRFLRVHRCQERCPHRRTPRLRLDRRPRTRHLPRLPPLPVAVDPRQVFRLPRLVLVLPGDPGCAGAPIAARAGAVQFGVEGFDAGRDGFEDGGHVGVSQVEVQGRGFGDEGELGVRDGHA